MATWYYMANQTDRIGPLDDSGMAAVINNGSIIHTTYVFKTGETEWKRASDYPELFMETKEAQPAIADTNSGSDLLPWTVRFINGTDGSWGIELDFSGLSADEGQNALRFFQMYHNASLSKQFPRIASGSHRQAISFFFPAVSEKPNNLFSLAPLDGEKVIVLRRVLAGMANELHAKQLGFWLVDPRLAFHADGQYYVVPSFWMPAFGTRTVRYQGLAPEWRDTGSQAKIDIYAIACACFQALTGEQHDPNVKRLPGEIIPETAGWDNVLAYALRDDPSRRPKDLASWLAEQSQSNRDQMHIQQAKPKIEQPIDTCKGCLPMTGRVGAGKGADGWGDLIDEIAVPAIDEAEHHSPLSMKSVIHPEPAMDSVEDFHPRDARGVHIKEKMKHIVSQLLPQCFLSTIKTIFSHPVFLMVWRVAVGVMRKHRRFLYLAGAVSVVLVGVLLVTKPTVNKSGNQSDSRARKQAGTVTQAQKNLGTRLHPAILFGKMQEVKNLLAAGADVNARDDWGNTPMHTAASVDNVLMLQLLKDYGASLDARNNIGGTVAHTAAISGGVQALQWLKNNGLNLNIRDNNGNTPKQIAEMSGLPKIVRWLANNGG